MFRGIKKAIRHPKTILRPAAKSVVNAVVRSVVQSAVGALGKWYNHTKKNSTSSKLFLYLISSSKVNVILCCQIPMGAGSHI